MIKLLVVDDHQVFRAGMQMLVDKSDDITIVADVATGSQALVQSRSISPDVIFLNEHISGETDADLVRRFRLAWPTVTVVIMTMVAEQKSFEAAMTAGACGYISKGCSRTEMLSAVRSAAAGCLGFDQDGPYVGEAGVRTQPSPTVVNFKLNRREKAILKLIYADTGTDIIARRLTIAPKTVRNYVSKLIKKLDANNRTDAAQKALNLGLFDCA